jgi:serine/threonine protein kinase
MIHRDIKLDNILFSSKDLRVKVTDFTVARADIDAGTRLFDSEGTPAFTAPECHIVAEGGYLPKPTDMWSFGVSLYAYVQQIVPFYSSGGELEMQINSRTKPLEVPDTFSPELRDLLERLLCKDPDHRLTAAEALSHPYFNGLGTIFEEPLE